VLYLNLDLHSIGMLLEPNLLLNYEIIETVFQVSIAPHATSLEVDVDSIPGRDSFCIRTTKKS
jgi:hypothetical protein